jgi:hypothetical protein
MNAILICSSHVLQAERHLCITKDFKWSDGRYFFFIVNGEADLMITRIGIQKRQQFTRHCGINNLTYSRQGILIFNTCFIQTCIINMHASITIMLFYKN